MASSFKELIAPLSERDFLSALRARSLTFLRGSDPHRYSGILDWDALWGVIERNEFPTDKLRVTREGNGLPSFFYSEKGKIEPARLARLLRDGASLIAEPLEPYIPALAALCSDIRARVHEKIKIGAVVTEGRGGALALHYDPEDLVILQLEGSKHWKIFGPAVVNPIRGMPKDAKANEDDVLFDNVLQPGDFLFLPAGYWHRCENGPERSLHLGIFFKSQTGWHAVETLLSRLLGEGAFRVPLGRLDAEARAAHAAVLRTQLIELIKQMPLENLDD